MLFSLSALVSLSLESGLEQLRQLALDARHGVPV